MRMQHNRHVRIGVRRDYAGLVGVDGAVDDPLHTARADTGIVCYPDFLLLELVHCNFTEFSSRVIGKLDAGGEAPLQPWVAGRVALGEPSQHSVAISGDDDDRKATIWINFTDQLAVCRLAVCQLVRLVDEQQPIVRVVDHLLDVAAQIGDAGRHVLTAQDTGCFERLVEGAHGCGFAGSRVAEKHKVAISGDTRESRLPLRAPLVEQQRVEKTGLPRDQSRPQPLVGQTRPRWQRQAAAPSQPATADPLARRGLAAQQVNRAVRVALGAVCTAAAVGSVAGATAAASESAASGAVTARPCQRQRNRLSGLVAERGTSARVWSRRSLLRRQGR
eukprot:1699726-Prymnesium_polylepis.2